VLTIIGTCALLGALAFLEWNGKRRPEWHWAVAAISVFASLPFLFSGLGSTASNFYDFFASRGKVRVATTIMPAKSPSR
jgi:hypothetical protein